MDMLLLKNFDTRSNLRYGKVLSSVVIGLISMHSECLMHDFKASRSIRGVFGRKHIGANSPIYFGVMAHHKTLNYLASNIRKHGG
jgi:hypothetical protein